MPSRRPRFTVFDTSVYVEDFTTGRFARQILESTFVPRCSAIVLHELLRGAQAPVERINRHQARNATSGLAASGKFKRDYETCSKRTHDREKKVISAG